MPALLARARFWPGIAALILVTSVLLPPAAGYTQRYACLQALQYMIFAVAGPVPTITAGWAAAPALRGASARPRPAPRPPGGPGRRAAGADRAPGDQPA
ncbi:MAG TPA: hypothetical protein VF070_19435 [Streptosporangiaceae bacterium]